MNEPDGYMKSRRATGEKPFMPAFAKGIFKCAHPSFLIYRYVIKLLGQFTILNQSVLG